MAISAGNLRNRAQVTRNLQSRTATGGITSIQEQNSIWCNIAPMTGKRADEYRQSVDEQPYKVTIRYFDRDQIRKDDVITWQGLEMHVKTISILDETLINIIAVARIT